MTARRQPRAQHLGAVLRIVADPSPSAHYACLLCHHTESVRGKAKTADFVVRIRTDHRATCPALHPKKGTTP